MLESAHEQAIRTEFPALEDAHAEIARLRKLINTPLFQRLWSRSIGLTCRLHSTFTWPTTAPTVVGVDGALGLIS